MHNKMHKSKPEVLLLASVKMKTPQSSNNSVDRVGYMYLANL